METTKQRSLKTRYLRYFGKFRNGKGRRKKTIALHWRRKSWDFSLLSSAKQQREMAIFAFAVNALLSSLFQCVVHLKKTRFGSLIVSNTEFQRGEG